MLVRLITRLGNAAQVPALAPGELGYDLDHKNLRIGDGTTSPPFIFTSKTQGEIDLSNLQITFNADVLRSFGIQGSNGWTAVLAIEDEFDRSIMRVVDWIGGSTTLSTKPQVGLYVTPNGLSTESALAKDLRGAPGPTGAAPYLRFSINNEGQLIFQQDDSTLSTPIDIEIDEDGMLVVNYSDSGDGQGFSFANRVFKGNWVNNRTYDIFSEVRYQGSIYRARGGVPVGIVPTNADYWVKIQSAPQVTINQQVRDDATVLTVANSVKVFRSSEAMYLTEIRAFLAEHQTSGALVRVQLQYFHVPTGEWGNVLDTQLTIDNYERTSTTAAVPATINTSFFPDDTEFRVNITQVGNGTAKGLSLALLGYKAD